MFPVIRSRSGPSHILAAVKTLSPPLTAPELGTALLALWDRWEGTPCWEDLPPAAQRYVLFVEQAVGCQITYVSVGPERDSILLRGRGKA